MREKKNTSMSSRAAGVALAMHFEIPQNAGDPEM